MMHLTNFFSNFIKNKKAVLGLPMRLTVSLIIGVIALAAIISYISNPCIFPDKIIVTVNPMVNHISNGSNQANFNIDIYVKDSDGYSIKNALVIVKGLNGINSSYTDLNGKTVVNINVTLHESAYEGYLDVIVKVPCYETFSQNDMIKIIRS